MKILILTLFISCSSMLSAENIRDLKGKPFMFSGITHGFDLKLLVSRFPNSTHTFYEHIWEQGKTPERNVIGEWIPQNKDTPINVKKNIGPDQNKFKKSIYTISVSKKDLRDHVYDVMYRFKNGEFKEANLFFTKKEIRSTKGLGPIEYNRRVGAASPDCSLIYDNLFNEYGKETYGIDYGGFELAYDWKFDEERVSLQCRRYTPEKPKAAFLIISKL